MPHPALFVLLLSLGAASALQAQSGPPAGSQPAQQPPAQQPGQPRDLMVAPSPAQKIPEARNSPGSQSAGVPANVCAELVAYFQKKAAAQADPNKPAKGSDPGQSGKQTAGPGQTAPPMDQVQQRSGLSAPIPQDDTKTGTTQVNMEQAQGLAQSNDLRGCQRAVQQMRRAGTTLPAGLLALAALREDLLAKSQSPSGQQQTPQAPPAPPK